MHHDAQKFNTTGLPLRLCRFSVPPEKSGRVKSGACRPTGRAADGIEDGAEGVRSAFGTIEKIFHAATAIARLARPATTTMKSRCRGAPGGSCGTHIRPCAGLSLTPGRQDPDVGDEIVGIEVAREDHPDLAPRVDHVDEGGVADQLW